MKKLTLYSTFFLVQHLIYSQGGGWVGNSPAYLASNGPSVASEFNVQRFHSEQSDEGASNYFLNKKGEHSFDLSLAYGVTKYRSSLLLGMDYSYGITDHLTYSAPFLFTYGLVNNQGRGHELALTVGVPTFGYSDLLGFLLLPTLGIKYSYGTDSFRGIAEFSVSKGLTVGRGRLGRDENDDFNKAIYLSSSLKAIYKPLSYLELETGLDSYFRSLSNFSNTLSVGPNFLLSDSTHMFLRANLRQDNEVKRDYGVIGGVKFHF